VCGLTAGAATVVVPVVVPAPTASVPRRVWRVSSTLAVALAAACSAPDVPRNDLPTMTAPHEKRSAPDLPFVHGPSITDAAALLPWLAAQRDGDRAAIVQLPVDRTGSEAHLAIAWRAAVDHERPVALQLDDAALGIALADRWSSMPPKTTRAAWLEGTWDAATSPPTLRVTRWLGHLTPAEFDAPKFARRTLPSATEPALVTALAYLGEGVPAAAKEDACGRLVAAGLAAVPLLLHSLADGRTFAMRDSVNRTNLPATEQPEPILVARTVGTRCDELLHRIVTPPPRQLVDHRGKVRSTQVLTIPDWGEFWRRRSGRTLAEIHVELTPLVDAYWAQQGTSQLVH